MEANENPFMGKRKSAHLRRYYKHYVLIIMILVLLLLGSAWLFVSHYKPILSDRLKRQVYLASDSLYRVEFSKVHLNPLLGSFTLDSFHLIPDTNTYNRLKIAHRAPPNLFDISIDEFKLRHAHLLSLVTRKTVNIKIIKAENPNILILHEESEDSGRQESVKETLFNLLSGPLKEIKIGHIGFHNISLVYKKKNTPWPGGNALDHMDLILQDIRIDSSTVEDLSRLLFAKDVWLHLRGSRFFTADSVYEISTGGIGFSVIEGKGIVKNFKVTPQLNDYEFDQTLRYRKNRFDISADSILFSGFSLHDLRERIWHVSRFQVRNMTADVYLNRGLPVRPVVKPLPQEILRESNLDLQIDTLRLKNINVKYRELNPNSEKIGYVTFNDITGNIFNITNDTSLIQKNKYCKADLQAMFMDKGALHAFFNFNLADPDNEFTFKGHLGYLNATTLNPATRPLGMVKIKSGRIHSLDYNLKADNSGAYGSVALKYDRLGVSVLSKDDSTGDLTKQGLISLAANLLVINDNNMEEGQGPGQSKVSYKRDPYRSVFNLMWKSIFSGVKPMVGVDKKTEEKINSLKEKGEKLKGNKGKGGKGNFFQKARDFLKKTTQSLENKK